MRKGIITITVMAILISMLLVGFGGTQVAAELGTMQACWRLDTGIGSDAFDSSDALNDGTLSGGKFGNALEFDGTDDYVDMPDDDSLDITGDLTVEAWVVADVINTYKSIIVKGDAYTEGKINYGVQIQAEQAAGTIRFFVWSPGYTWVDSTSQIPLDGNWHHVAVTHDTSNNVKIFIDGTLSGSGTLALGPISNSPLDIGRHKHATVGIYQYWDGKIDEVRISNIVRYTSNFIPQTSEFTSDVNTAGLWHFDESVGTTAYDETTNGNDGSINGAIWAGPTWTTGKYGNALQFDGVDDYVDCGPVFDVTNKLTIEAWVKDSGQSDGSIVGKHEAMNKRWHIYVDSKGQWGSQIIYWNIGGSNYATSPTSDIGTDWHHLAMVYDGTQSGNSNRLKAYIDGVAVTLSYYGTIPATMPAISANVNIGRHGTDLGNPNQGTKNFFKGIIDEVRIWDGALTACEVELAMQGKLDILPDAGVIVYYNSIHNVASDETVTIEILPSDTSVIIDSVSIHRVTPNNKNSVNLDEDLDVTIQGCYSVDITIVDVPAKVKTVHLWITLSTGEHIPVNLHYGH